MRTDKKIITVTDKKILTEKVLCPIMDYDWCKDHACSECPIRNYDKYDMTLVCIPKKDPYV